MSKVSRQKGNQKSEAQRQREMNSILMQLMVLLEEKYALVPAAFHDVVSQFVKSGEECRGEVDFEEYDRTLIYHLRNSKPCMVNLHKKSE